MNPVPSAILTEAVETLSEIRKDLLSVVSELYESDDKVCELAGSNIEDLGYKLTREIAFIEKIADAAKVLEEKV